MTDSSRFNFDELLHPALAFSSPAEVVSDPDLTLQEKRAILSSWASDACAVEAMPEIRSHPSGSTARFDEIISALRELDRRRPDKSIPPHRPRRGRSGNRRSDTRIAQSVRQKSAM